MWFGVYLGQLHVFTRHGLKTFFFLTHFIEYAFFCLSGLQVPYCNLYVRS